MALRHGHFTDEDWERLALAARAACDAFFVSRGITYNEYLDNLEASMVQLRALLPPRPPASGLVNKTQNIIQPTLGTGTQDKAGAPSDNNDWR